MCYYGTSLLADLKGRRRFVPPLKSSAGSRKSGNRNAAVVNGTGAGSSEAPRNTSEKKVCYILARLGL